MISLRCLVFGHDWLHLDTHFVDGDRLASSHLCDRCDSERTVILEVTHLADLDEDAESSDIVFTGLSDEEVVD